MTRVAGFVLAFALFLFVPFLGLSDYYMRLINLSIVMALLSVSLNLLVGFAGQISLGHAGFFGIGAYTTALLTAGGSGGAVWLGLVAATVVTALVGAAIGVPTLRLKGHYLALATLGFGEIMRQLFYNWREVTHGMDGIAGIPAPALGGFALSSNERYYFLVLAFLAVTIALVWLFETSAFGLRLKAVRDAELAAGASGINVTRYKVITLAASAGLAGLAGALYAHMITYISPDVFTFDLTAQVLAMVVIGGLGTVVGPVFGAFALTFLPEMLRVSNIYYQLIYGFGIVLIVLFFPLGLGGWFSRLRERWMDRTVALAPVPEKPATTPATVRDLAPVSDCGTSTEPLLRATQATRRFGGLVAVNAFDLEVRRGAIHALIGPNGSGKSTFINLASGIYRLSDGHVSFDGAQIDNWRTWAIAQSGLVRTFQNLRLFSTLTVEENVIAAAAEADHIPPLSILHGPQGPQMRMLREKAHEAMAFAGVEQLGPRVVKALPHEVQRAVEIARALVRQPKLIMLDEPAAGLNPREADRLIERIRALREAGITILLVEHNMPLVMRVADRITVLNFGKKIAEGTPEAIKADPAVIEAYLGRRLSKRLEQHVLAGA